jgi:hypothetical protein
MLFLLVVLSFGIAIWSGANLSTVIIIIVSLAILAMIVGIISKQRRRKESRNRGVIKRKTGMSTEQKQGIVLGLVIIAAFLLLVATPWKDWFKQSPETITSVPSLSIGNWFGQNLHTIITVLLLLAASALVIILIWISRRNIVRWITSILSHGNGHATCIERYTWFPISIQDERILRIRKWILDFNPKGDYDLEDYYHAELFDWLKYKDPQAISKQQRGTAIPDIAIGDIAIEVKGPTENRDLGTIPDKSWRYLVDGRYNFLFIVLFKPKFSEGYYSDIVRGLRRHYPYKAAIITKK